MHPENSSQSFIPLERAGMQNRHTNILLLLQTQLQKSEESSPRKNACQVDALLYLNNLSAPKLPEALAMISTQFWLTTTEPSLSIINEVK